MARYTEWYAVELDGYLKGRISDVARFEAVKEVMSHFAEHVDDLIEKGMEPVEAEKAAVKTFGNPRMAAINLLRQGGKPNLGRAMSIVGCLGMIVIVFQLGIGYQTYYLKQTHDFSSLFINFAAFVLIAFLSTVIGLIGGTILLRKVPAKMMLASSFFGIVLVCSYYFANANRPYAEVPPKNFDAMVSKWESTMKAEFSIAKIHDKITETLNGSYDRGEYKAVPTATTSALIKSEAPKLLAFTGIVRIDGKLTSGYLGPYNYGSSESMASGQRHVLLDSSAPTGPWFPVNQMRLQYYATSNEAVAAWSKASQWSSTGYSDYVRLGQEQNQFIAEAQYVHYLPRPMLFARTIGPFAGITILVTFGMILIGWLLTRIPNVTIQSSFRRRLA